MCLRQLPTKMPIPRARASSQCGPRRCLTPLMVLLGLLLGSCGDLTKGPPSGPPPALVKIAASELPVFVDDMAYDGLLGGIEESLSYLERIPVDSSFQFGDDSYSATHMIKSLRHIKVWKNRFT